MSPVSFCSSGTWAKIGIASSPPMSATGTIGTAGAHGGTHEAATAEAPQPVALPEELAGSCFSASGKTSAVRCSSRSSRCALAGWAATNPILAVSIDTPG